jgi:hypothetical protein
MPKALEQNLSLVLTEDSSQKDHSRKDQISKKLDKIEKLKTLIIKDKEFVTTAKSLYQIHIGETIEQLNKTKIGLIQVLFKRYKQKSFTQWQKDLLIDKLLNELDHLKNQEFESNVITQIDEELRIIQEETLTDEEKQMVAEMARNHLDNLGFDIDPADLTYKNLSNPNFINDKQDEFFQKQKKFEEEIKQNKKQKLERDTDKDFQKLYRDLAKKAHPDLVTDNTEKEIRSEWMKQLTEAWESRDYYQILLLEREITQESSSILQLKTNQIKPIIDSLNEELRQLEITKYRLRNDHPDTAYFFQNFNAKSEKGILKKIKEFKLFVEQDIAETKLEVHNLKSQETTKRFLSQIRGSQDFFDMDTFGYDLDKTNIG